MGLLRLLCYFIRIKEILPVIKEQNMNLVLPVTSSSSCLGLAAACNCGTP